MATTEQEARDRQDLETVEEGSPGSSLPESVEHARDGKIGGPGEEELDATAWLLEVDDDAAAREQIKPTVLRLNVSRDPEKRQMVEWHIVPLDGDTFRRFRQLASGSRAARRGNPAAAAMDMDDSKYHLLCVTQATVFPDLRDIAAKKGVADPAEVVKHRFRDKPGLIVQISGYISDISGYEEADVEVAAKNS